MAARTLTRLFVCALTGIGLIVMVKARRERETANSAIEEQLHSRLAALEEHLKGDVLAYSGPICQGADDEIRDAVEHRFGVRKARKYKLCVILETLGGYIEVAERIAGTFRRHYRKVDFLVPSHAMSAGTVLVLSGDSIYMDYYSTLGPIDPQVERDGHWIPALGYLKQYKRLIAKSKKNELTNVEAAYFVENFDPAELYQYEQSQKLSIRLLTEWLVQYKFRGWRTTETRGVRVTRAMKEHRAKQVARLLSKTDEWHSHGRGISMAVLRKKAKLKIDDFGEDQELDRLLKSYHRLLTDYMRRVGTRIAAHVVKRYSAF